MWSTKTFKTKESFDKFWQKEVRKIEDKFIDTSCYSDEMNHKRDIIRMFDEWCMNYCG